MFLNEAGGAGAPSGTGTLGTVASGTVFELFFPDREVKIVASAQADTSVAAPVQWKPARILDGTIFCHSAQRARKITAATAMPSNKLMRSVTAQTTGSSFNSPREASSHARLTQKIISGSISHKRFGR